MKGSHDYLYISGLLYDTEPGGANSMPDFSDIDQVEDDTLSKS